MVATVQRKRIEILVDTPLVPRLFADEVAPLLESHGLLITIGNVEVVRGERF